MGVNDSKLCDIAINIGNLTIENAYEILFLAVRSKRFQTIDLSKKAVDDLIIMSHVRAALQLICEASVLKSMQVE